MISIIIPMYNVEDKIERTLSCIENQEIKEKYEIIIIDDCSVDNSYNICKKYIKSKRIKNAILLKNTENRGPSYTRNRGMKLAKGEYCILLDSDDYYEENTINIMLENMKPKSIVVVGIKYMYRKNKIKYLLYGEKNRIMNIGSNQYAKFYLTGLLNQPSNKMYDLNYIKEKNIFFNENSSYGEDLEFNIKYTENIEDIIYINEPLYVYTESPSGLNNTYKNNELEISKKNFDNKLEILKNRYCINNEIEQEMYKMYIKERIRFYYRFNKFDSRKDKREYLKKIINKDDLNYLLKKANMDNKQVFIIKQLVNLKLYFLARVYLKFVIS